MKLFQLLWFTLPVGVTVSVVLGFGLIQWTADRGLIPEEGVVYRLVAFVVVAITTFTTVIVYLLVLGE